MLAFEKFVALSCTRAEYGGKKEEKDHHKQGGG